jgi:TolB-like protein
MNAGKILLATLIVGISPIAFADNPPAAPYVAPPSAAVAPPPVAQAAPTVLVLPFQQTGDTNSFSWIAPAIQEDLLAQIAHNGVFQALSATQPVAGADSASAIQIARNSNANVVVFGGYQVVSDQVRIDAQAVDVASGRTIGSLQATGQVSDLFKMEDALAAQLGQLLPSPPGSNMPTVTYGTPNAPMYDQVDNGLSNYYATPDNSSGYAGSYPYPYYYGYPYYPVIIYGGFFNHRPFFPGRCFVPRGGFVGGGFVGRPGFASPAFRGTASFGGGMSGGHR